MIKITVDNEYELNIMKVIMSYARGKNVNVAIFKSEDIVNPTKIIGRNSDSIIFDEILLPEPAIKKQKKCDIKKPHYRRLEKNKCF